MNRNIRLVAHGLFVAFGLIAASLIWWQVVRASDLTADARINSTRLAAEADRIRRGRILDRRGAVLAETVRGEGGQVRRYPDVNVSHVVGYHSPRRGNAGVEAAYNGWLRGERANDPVTELLERALRRERVGADVVLTLDSRLQGVADAALGDQRGAVVALDPRDGAILALVSHPLYDPNTIDRTLDRLLQQPATPLLNRATQGLYPPGSTFKVVTEAAALDAGAAQAGTRFALEATREIRLNGYTLRWENPLGRALTLSEALVHSCNTCFAELGIALGPERLRDYATRFGFEARPPIEVDAAVSRLGRREYLQDRGGLGFTAFGQGELEATPLQMALVAAAIANGGRVPTPHVALDVRDRQGRVLAAFRPGPWRTAVRPDVAREVGQSMVALVEAGQAPAARLGSVRVAGKTGTAEVRPGVEPHAWFIAYAPAEAPTVAVAVIIENGGFGSRAAAPVAARVIETALAR